MIRFIFWIMALLFFVLPLKKVLCKKYLCTKNSEKPMLKKIIFTIICLTTFGTTLLTAQATRKVMVEEFTNASCAPCAAQNPTFDALMLANKSKVTLLKYQVWWPGSDPMYDQNTADVRERTTTYYGVNAVPYGIVDGINTGVAGNVDQTLIDNAAAISTPLEIKLDHNLTVALDSIKISCTIKNVDVSAFNPGNTVVQIAIVETINFPSPPGTNTEQDFIQVMRKMLPNALGSSLPAIPAGDSVTFSFCDSIPDYIYEYGKIGVVAFVQNNTTKVVYQSELSEPKLLPFPNDDVAVVNSSIEPLGFCDYNFEPRLTITNVSATNITQIDASYRVNGGIPVSMLYTNTLTPANSNEIIFPQVNLPGGTNIVTYDVLVNGHPDLNRHNNDLGPHEYHLLQVTPVFSGTLSEGFETTPNAAVPANTIILRNEVFDMSVVDASVFGSAPGPVGAYQLSNKSVLVRFFNMAAGTTSEMIFEKIDLSTRVNSRITFDHAYRSYQGENDRLQIMVSPDCGASWDIVYDEQGSSLATLPPSTVQFIPSAQDWTSDTIDISQYDNAPELTMRLVATSAFGNNLFFDNLQISSDSLPATGSAIPTVSQWGLILLVLGFLILSVVAIHNQQRALSRIEDPVRP